VIGGTCCLTLIREPELHSCHNSNQRNYSTKRKPASHEPTNTYDTLANRLYQFLNVKSLSVRCTAPRIAPARFIRPFASIDASCAGPLFSTVIKIRGNTLFLQTPVPGWLAAHTMFMNVAHAKVHTSIGNVIQYHDTVTCITGANALPLLEVLLAMELKSRNVLDMAFATRSRPQEIRLSLCASAQPV
jgi:hypothetical protein